MVDISGFNAANHEPTAEYELLPEGKYHAEIVDSEERDIGQDGSKGSKITFKWKVISGPCEGRLVFQDILHAYNVQGEKGDKTRDIAARQLSAVCHATGKLAPSNTDELHHIPCELSVGFQKQNKDPDGNLYAKRNEVKGVKEWGNSRPATGVSATASRSTAPQGPSSSAPSGGGWNRRAG